MDLKQLFIRLGLALFILVGGGALMISLYGGLSGPASEGPQAELLSEAQARSALQELGFEVVSLKRNGGLYKVTLLGGEITYFDAIEGKVIEIDASRGSAMQPQRVAKQLEEFGYREVAPVLYTRGAFRTTAINPDGQAVELTLDTYSGEVLEELPK